MKTWPWPPVPMRMSTHCVSDSLWGALPQATAAIAAPMVKMVLSFMVYGDGLGL